MRRTARIVPLLVACASEPATAPPAHLTTDMFDCNAGDPVRTSPVPLDCINDSSCEMSLVTGHRGAGGGAALYAPENSVAAVRFAILAGLDVIEIDVRHTADDRLVVMHDADLSRTTGDPRAVSMTAFDDILQVPLDATGFPGDHACARVPSFREVLDLARGRINIDVDTKTDRADLVALEIRDAAMIDQAFVSVSTTEKLVLARQAVAEVKLQARPDTPDAYEAILARLDRPPEIIEVPITEVEAFVPIAEAAGSKLFTNVFFEDVVAYAEGDVSAYRETYDRGADILQSEFPTFVVDTLGRRAWASWPPHRPLDIGDSPLLGE